MTALSSSHRSTRPGTHRKSIRSCSNRTPYSVAPYGLKAYKETIGPSPLFQKEGYIFVYQDVRGRSCPKAQFVEHAAAQREEERTERHRRKQRHLRHDRLAGEERSEQQRPRGHVGHLVPGFYTSAGMIDAHPALKAASPQAPIADWFIGDDFHHNGALFLPHAFNFFSRLRHAARRSRPPNVRRLPVRTRHAGRLRVFSGDWGRCRTPTRSTSRTRSRSGTR